MHSRQAQEHNAKFFLTLLIGLSLFFFISYTNRLIEFGEEQAQVDVLQGKIAAAELEQARLRAHLSYVKSDIYVEQVSRQEFGLSLPGDRVVIVMPDNTTAAVDTVANESGSVQSTPPAELPPIPSSVLQIQSADILSEPIWRQWFILFSSKRSANLQN